MTDKVDLMVVGVEEGISRTDMSDKLVKKFQQEAYSFEALLDGAYGESAPYAAQSGVERSLAEEGRVELEKLGLICQVAAPGEAIVPKLPVQLAAPKAESQAADTSGSLMDGAADIGAADDIDLIDKDTKPEDEGLASFRAGDANAADADSALPDLSFDSDEAAAGESALAGFKNSAKNTKSEDNGEVDFTDDLGAVGGDDAVSVGLADAKKSKNNINDVDDPLSGDFSDQIEEVGGDEVAVGLKEGSAAKPDFDAKASDVDFNDDIMSIDIEEKDGNSSTAEAEKNTLQKEQTESNSVSDTTEKAQESVDFSDEIEGLSLSEEATPVGSENTEKSTPEKTDVPEALAKAANIDLDAELIDPAPLEKQASDKAPVEIDDGGLTLSTNDDAPLTAAREKSNVQAPDDGGLSLAGDDSQPLTAASTSAEPDGAESAPADLNVAESSVPGNDSESLSADDAAEHSAVKASLDAADDGIAIDAAPDIEVAVSEPAPATSKEPVKSAADTKQEETKAEISLPEADAPEPVESNVAAFKGEELSSPTFEDPELEDEDNEAPSGGLVLPGQISSSVMPTIMSEEDLDKGGSSVAPSSVERSFDLEDETDYAAPYASQAVEEAMELAKKPVAPRKSKKKLIAAMAGIAVLAGAGTFAFMNAGSLSMLPERFASSDESLDVVPLKDSTGSIEKMNIQVAELKPGADLDNLSTGELLVNLSDNNSSNGILNLEPYFLESGAQVKRRPRIGAAVPAESEWMVRNRQPHPADKYFDEWSNRDSDLSLFLALLDNLIAKGDLDVAQQLSDRAKDKLFSVMSTQRLARAYSDVSENTQVSRLLALATRDTYAIKAPEERVLALSDYAFTEQAIGLNEDAMDTFLKTSILARSLAKPETRTVGLSSAAMYFHRAGRTKQALELLEQAMQAGNELPANTAARDLAVRYVALSEARMGLFNQALDHTKLIVDPFATVSAYHGIALAIESTGDDTNARKVLNMAYRAGSLIENKDERSKLLSKVILASETE